MSAQLRSLLMSLSAPSRPARPTWRRLLERSSRTGLALLALSGSLPLVGGLQVLALPTGEQTERGNPVRVDRSDANKLTVQTQGRTVISWKDFNIEAGKSVEFQNDKTVLNYVRRGGGASRLDGTLRATNPIILLNNQGITVGSTALISVPSILLSTGSLLPDSFDKFMQGVDYGGGLNAPLISIQLSNSDGAVAIDGTIKTIKGGGIGLIAPTLTVGPTAVLKSLGSRDSSTGTDGVNVTVNGVEAKGSLWLGTTALSAASFTQPIPGMPGASLPTLPTGFGFTQVGGKPSPQRIQLALQATYDFERVVIGSSGATAGQFDSLFFSPSFRAADFYVYDGIQAIEEGHRQATSGELRRTLTNAQTHQLISDQLEATILGLKLPTGATLIQANDITLDANGQISSGNLLVDPGGSMGPEFVKAFGPGPFTILFNGGQASIQGTNSKSGTYDIATGQITWTATVTTPGQPVSTTETVAGTAIDQGTSTPPEGVSGVAGESVSFVSKEATPGTQGHSWQPCHTGNSGCKGGSPEQRSTATFWKGRFVTDASGQQRFVPDAQAATDVVYEVGGRYFVVPISQWSPEATPKNPSFARVTPQVTRTVTTPGTDTTETRTFTDYFKVDRKVSTATGAAESTWTQPTTPGPNQLTPTPTPAAQTTAPTTPPYNVPDPTVAPPSSAPTQPPAGTTSAPTKGLDTQTPGPQTPQPSAAVSTTTPKTPAPTAAVPTQVPQPTPGVVNFIPQPTLVGFAPYNVPNPTAPPPRTPQPTAAVPTLAPSPTTGVVPYINQPTITGYAPYKVPPSPGVSAAPTPTVAVPTAAPEKRPLPTTAVPYPTPPSPGVSAAPTPTVAVPTAAPEKRPLPTTAVPYPTPPSPGVSAAPTPTVAVPTAAPEKRPLPTTAVPTPTAAVPTLAPTPTTGVVPYNTAPSFTGFAPVTVAPPSPPPTRAPQATPAPQPATPGPQPQGSSVPTSAGIKPVLMPRGVSPASIQSGAEADRIRRGLAVTYEVPRELINARVPGALAARSRATLPDGRALPAEIDYDPNDQTFTIRDTSRLPLPLDVRLTMPTSAGGQGSFVLTIGSP